jgi:uncharacterized protein (TIGR02231 family)
MVMYFILAVASIGLALSPNHSAEAAGFTIDTTPTWDGMLNVGPWSTRPSGTETIGQVISTPSSALADVLLDDFTFFAGGSDAIFNYKAHVYQNTGIDWENAQLSLSTNNPYTNKTKPTLSPWYLDYSYAIYHNGPSRADDLRESSEYDGATQPGSLYSASQKDEVYSEKKALTADQFITTVEQLLSGEYSIALPYTIKSNNEKNMVLVKTANLDANYLYYTVPKLDASVYLIAKITNLDDLNLLPGKATIFHDGSYLGTTYINSNSLSDTMDLSLGKSSTIIVERNLIKNATKEKVVGDKIIKTFAYSIDVKNLGKLPIELITEDQIPISRNPEIKLTIDNMTKGALNEINGFVTWREKIKALGTVRYEIVYTIEYDKTKPINLASN